MILAFETPVGGPSPQDVADRNRRRADPSGYAVINFYDVGVWNEAFPHVSVTVVPNNTGNPITSELIQEANSQGQPTGNALIGIDVMIPRPSFSTPRIPLPNAVGAQAFQSGAMGAAGPYSKMRNSCFTHVANVLRAGGAPVPPGTSAGVPYIRRVLTSGP